MIILTEFKYGKIFVSDKDVYIGRTLMSSGQYCDEEVDIFKQILNLNDNVIEVGANIGSLSVPISQIIGDGKLFAIEPQQYIYNMLCANIAVNNRSNVQPMKMAIGEITSQVKLPIINYETVTNFGGIEINDTNTGESVIQQTLDDSFSELETLKLIKIDVEGMEIGVLNGGKNLINKHRPFIYCENDRSEKTKELFTILTDLKYNIYKHISHVFNKPNFKNNEVNPFGINYICINILAIPSENSINCDLEKLN